MKNIVVGSLLLILLILAGCSGGGKYADVKGVLNDSIKANEELGAALVNADTAKKFVEALNPYVEKMVKLGPKLESFYEKYPELKENPPEDIKEIMAKFEKSVEGMALMFPKLMEFAEDPEVQKAVEKFEKMAPQ